MDVRRTIFRDPMIRSPSTSDILEKKKLGEFYTPIEVVKYILDRMDYTSKSKIEDKFVIDPACGLGIFLLEVVSRLVERYKKIGFDVDNPDDVKSMLNGISEHVYGIDINPEACEIAKENILSLLDDFYKKVKERYKNYKLKLNIFCFNSLLPNKIDRKFDFVMGNPPYLRIHRIKPELRKLYKQTYKSATGRYDTSVLFIERGINWLNASGKLGYITSNKFLTSNYGMGIRKIILDECTIDQILDLRDVKIFRYISVLPCILIIEKERRMRDKFFYAVAKKVNVLKDLKKIDNLLEFIGTHLKSDFNELIEIENSHGNIEKLNVRCFEARIPEDAREFWHFVPPDEQKTVDKLNRVKTHMLKEISRKINVGIKTTANQVFADQITKKFIEEENLETEVVHPVLRGPNVKRWQISWGGNIEKKETYIIYPHKKHGKKVVPIDLNEYPNVKKYLQENRQPLENRSYIREAKRNWYEIWVHQDPDDFKSKLKIVTSDISPVNSFMLDTNQFFCLDSCYYITLKNNSEDLYKFMLGLLNSKVIEFFHKRAASTHIYSNRYRYMTSYMRNYPIVSYLPNLGEGLVKYDIINRANEILQEIKEIDEIELRDDKLYINGVEFKFDGEQMLHIFRYLVGREIIHRVDKILRAVKKNELKEVSRFEDQLNKFVYILYRLDKSEQNLIEKALSIY